MNILLNQLADELLEQEIEMEYSEFIQNMLHEIYSAEAAAHSYDLDAEYYGEVA